MLREDYDTGYRRLSEHGFSMALETTTALGERSALFDTQSESGGFVEVMELNIAFSRLTDAMAAAHESFDGMQPQRPLDALFATTPH